MKSRILFVEDEERGVLPYFYELEKNEFECALAKNGDEAMEKINKQKFDIISIDIMFNPGTSLGNNIAPIKAGMRLLEIIRLGKIKNCDPAIKVVVLTAVSDPNIENEIRKLGVSAYLKKPIDFTEVIKTFCSVK